MDRFYNSRCKFLCREAGLVTKNLEDALEISQSGFDVLFYYNGKYVGELIYGGEIETISDMPETSYGMVFYCHETKGFCCHIQDKILNAKPLVEIHTVTYSVIGI